MFDIGWPELFVVAAVTLVVVGPKEIPNVLRNVMGWVKKARSLATEFQTGVDEMVREAELDKLKDELTEGGDMDFAKEMEDALDPTGEAESALDFDMSDFDGKALPGDDEWTDARPAEDAAKDADDEVTENSMLDDSQLAQAEASGPDDTPPADQPADKNA